MYWVFPFFHSLIGGTQVALMLNQIKINWSILLICSHLFTYTLICNIYISIFISKGSGYATHYKGLATLGYVTQGTSYLKCQSWQNPWQVHGDLCAIIILSMGSANERHCYNITLSLIGWAHTENDPWNAIENRLFQWIIFFTTFFSSF